MTVRSITATIVALTLTAIVGIAAGLVIAKVVDGRGLASTTCQNAAVELTVGKVGSSRSVFAQVIVTDDLKRQWDVAWPTAGRTPPQLEIAAPGSYFRHGFLILGDTDDGPERTIRLRPHGSTEWCSVTAGVS